MEEYITSVISETGLNHIKNEDRTVIISRGDRIWLGLFDGISAGGGGDLAAELACSAMRSVVASCAPDDDIPRMGKAIISAAQHNILAKQQENDRLYDIGTTVIISCVDKERADIHWFSLGDSAIYLCRMGKTPEKITIEDSPNGYLLAKGRITQKEAARMPLGNALDWYLGKHVNPDVLWEHTHKGKTGIGKKESVLLCSDGLYSRLSAKRIGRLLNKRRSIEGILSELVKKAKANGSEDDISIIYATPKSVRSIKGVHLGIAIIAAIFFFGCGYLCGVKASLMKGRIQQQRPVIQELVQGATPIDTTNLKNEE